MNVPQVPVGALSPSNMVIFRGISLALVGISNSCTVSWFMRNIFAPESRRTFIVCFHPLG